MGDLYDEYLDDVDAGLTDLPWEEWIIDRMAIAYDRAKAARQDAGVP